MTLISLEKV